MAETFELFDIPTVQNYIGMKFCEIPAGSFMMGSPEVEVGLYSENVPQHLVTFEKSFWMQETAVTRSQWLDVMGIDPSHFQDGDLSCPVEMVSWDDCQAFIEKLNELQGVDFYRLPSEAEWVLGGYF